MTIRLPDNLESSILEEVESGHYASVDEAIAEAVRLLLRRDRGGVGEERADAGEQAESDRKPIWEVFEEITATIPEAEWAKLPADGAEQHDHYLHGAARRPAS